MNRLDLKRVVYRLCRREGDRMAGAACRLPAAGNTLNQFNMATQGQHVAGLCLLWRRFFCSLFLSDFL